MTTRSCVFRGNPVNINYVSPAVETPTLALTFMQQTGVNYPIYYYGPCLNDSCAGSWEPAL